MHESIMQMIDKNPDEYIVDIEGVARHGWSCGYIVKHNNRLYFVDEDMECVHRMPKFIKSPSEAVEFIKAADRWYYDGVSYGAAKKASEIRSSLGITKSLGGGA